MATIAHCGGSFRSPTTTSSAEVRSTHMIHSAGSRSGLTNDSGCFHTQDDGADSATQLHRLSESPLRRHWLGMAVADADGSGNNTNTTTNTTTTSSSPSTGTSTPAVVPLTDPTVRRRPLGAMRSAQRVVVPRELETATDHPFSPSPHDTTFRPSTVAQTGTTRTDVSAETASNSATSPPLDRPSTTAACRLHSRRRGSRGASAVTFIPLTMDEQLNMRLPILEVPPHHTPQHVGQRHVSQMEEHAVRDDADLLLDAPSAVVLATTDEGVFGACDCGDAAASKTPSSGVAALFASPNTHTHAHHHHHQQQQQQRQPLPIMADASPSPPPTRTHTRVSSYTTLPSVPHFMSFTGVEELLDASPRLNDDDDDLDASWSTGLESSMCGSSSSATSCLFCAAARAGALSDDDDDDDDGILEGVALEEGTKRVGSGTMGVRSVDTRTFRGKNHSNNNNEEEDDGCTNGVGACAKTTVPRKHRCCPHQQPHNHCHHHHRPHRHRRRRLHGVHLRHYYRRSRGDAERPHAPTSHASCEAWSLSYVGLPVFEANANHGGERSPALSRGGGGMNAMMMEGVAEDGRSPSRVSSAQPCWRGVTPGRCPRSPSLMSSKNFPQGATTSADAPRSPVAAQPAKDVAGEAANTSNLLSAPTSPALSTLASGRLHAWAVRGGARRPSLSTGTPSRTRHHAYHRHAGLRAVGSSFTLGDVDGHGQSADDSWSF